MKAYDLAMGLIFLNAGIYLVATMNLFGDLSAHTGVFESLGWLTNPIFRIGTWEIKGIDGLAIIMALATVVFYNSNAVNDRGVAIAAFSFIFWASYMNTSVIITSFELPGISEFFSVFTLGAALLFAITLIQMPTGGQKAFE